MKKILATLLLLALPALVLASDLDFAYRIPAELQITEAQALGDLTWQQGSTPLIQAEVLRRGKPVTADALTTVRMIIGPSATSTYYAVTEQSTTTGTSYYVQWPTVGTNTVGTNTTPQAWWYTIYFERNGHRYWTGNGDLYIERTTSTDADGLVWQTMISTTNEALWKAASNMVVYTSDARLTNSRTPIAHNQAWSTITSTPTTLTGYGISDAVTNTDARLTDARTPTAHNQNWNTITSTPDSVSGYGITNPIIYEGDSRLADNRDPNPHDQAWSTITGTPTTVAGYGITDGATGMPVYAETDPAWAGKSNSVAYTNDSRLTDARAPLAHDQGWTTITGTPDNIAAYGITNDIIFEGDIRLTDSRAPTAHDQDWNTITGAPVTIGGYGITDAWTKTESDLRFGTTGSVAELTADLASHKTNVDVHAIAAITGLQGELDGKSSTGHVHTIDGVTGLQTALDGKATTGDMAQAQADIGDLQGATGVLNVAVGNLQGLTNSVIYTNDVSVTNSRDPNVHNQSLASITNAGTMAGASTGDYYLASNPSNYVDVSVTNGVNARVDTITNGNVQGATAYGWGNHATNNYATGTPVYVETDSIATNQIAIASNALSGRIDGLTNGAALGGTALQPGAAGTWTNLSEYNNDLEVMSTNLSDYNNDTLFVTISVTNDLNARVDGLTNIYAPTGTVGAISVDVDALKGQTSGWVTVDVTNAVNTRIDSLTNGAALGVTALQPAVTSTWGFVDASVTNSLNAVVETKASTNDLTAHTTNTANPHAVTAAQVGAVATNDERYLAALTNETYTGTLTNIVVNNVTGTVATGVASVTITASQTGSATTQDMVAAQGRLAALEVPYQPYSTNLAAVNGTCTITYACGSLVKIEASAPVTLTFDNAAYPTSGVSRVGVEIITTTSVAFATATITNATAPTISATKWNSLFFRRTANEDLWKGRQ